MERCVMREFGVLKTRITLRSIRAIWFFFFLWTNLSFATILALPAKGNTVGDIEYALPQSGETLGEVGIRYDMGYAEMVKVNPHVNPSIPLSPQVKVLIPSKFILPKVPRRGLVIDLTKYRLYYFPENDNIVVTYPIGIGRKGFDTPRGVTKIIAKQINPTWRPTANVLAYAAKNGVDLPDEIPPGPINPLGKYVLRLGWATYLIHGSNNIGGIGERISAGCIRMLPDDIEYLFSIVNVGTSVLVIK